MKLKIKIFRSKEGLETITGVFMLLLMFTVIIGLVAAFSSYNQSAEAQMQREQERSKEQITLTRLTSVDGKLSTAIIENTGTIEVQIRALYKILDGKTTFICDPSATSCHPKDPNISPGGALTLNLTSYSIESEAMIIATTERGVKTINNLVPQITPTPRPSPLTHQYTYGLIQLLWVNFQYTKFDGNFNPNGQWKPAWIVESDTHYVAWKATITNIGSQDIILNEQSSFTTVSSDSSDLRSWYLYSGPLTKPQATTLPVDQPVDVIFVWREPATNSYKGIYEQPTVAMVFLTFFGSFEDGNPYAQTVPFEAAITVV